MVFIFSLAYQRADRHIYALKTKRNETKRNETKQRATDRSHLILYYITLSYLTLSYLTLSYLTSSYLKLVLAYLIWSESYLISSYLHLIFNTLLPYHFLSYLMTRSRRAENSMKLVFAELFVGCSNLALRAGELHFKMHQSSKQKMLKVPRGGKLKNKGNGLT